MPATTPPATSTATAPVLLTSTASGVCTITLNRPDRLNAVNSDLAVALPAALREAAGDDTVRVVVITGAGRGFCAGLDLKEPAGIPATSVAERLDPNMWVGRWARAVTECDKPVIAAVNGVAAGAGLALALACDIRLLAASARLAPGYMRIGLSPDAGMSWFLPRLAGMGRAMELLLTARELDAAEAQAMGLASMVVPDESLVEQVSELAARLAASSPIALALTKRAVIQGMSATLEQQLAREVEFVRVCAASEEFAEGLRNFLESR
ncbi:MAG TPA: enoyl-CoA hydratase-related protein [Gemmatimonadales bacterium]|nr:enoyl-CoA hydratase-related protein [Gemmatimonadales bacterium]